MQTLQSANDFCSDGRKTSIAIGMFDGVHLGHQQVIRQAVADAEQHEGTAVVVTFDRHPNAVVAPDRVPPLIYSPVQKLRAIESLGAGTVLVIPFTREFSELSAHDFIQGLATRLAPVESICVGSSFVFGRQRGGDVALLRRLGTDLGFSVHGLAAVALDGEVVSSTRIREAIRSGELDRASQMLGRAYALAGTVVHGDELGRKLGFPTANMDIRDRLVPPQGVYAAHAYVDGTRYRAVVNIGTRPTVSASQPEVRVEAHLLEFTASLYGCEVELMFVERLRGERRFASLDELRAQIAEDVRTATSRF